MQTILNLPKTIAKFLIRVYQKTLSFDHAFWANPQAYRVCIHYPSCSEYTYEAIDRFGLLKGSVLGFWRVLRCAPWGKVDMIQCQKNSKLGIIGIALTLDSRLRGNDK